MAAKWRNTPRQARKKPQRAVPKKIVPLKQAFAMAQDFHSRGALGQAQDLYRQILQSRPEHVGSVHYLGVAAYQQGRNDEALELICRAIELKADYAEAHHSLGCVLVAEGLPEQAIAAFHRAVQIKGDYGEAYINLADVLRGQGRLDQALAACRHATRLAPNDARGHYQLGCVLAEKGLYVEAVSAYRGALKIKSDWAEAWANLGNSLERSDQPDQAIDAFRRSLALDTKCAEVHHNLGRVLNQQGLFDEAIASYRRAIELDGDNAEFHNNLGCVLARRYFLDEAIKCFQRALELDSDLEDAHVNLCRAFQTDGRVNDEIVAVFRRMAELHPNDPGKQNDLACSLIPQGKYTEAIEVCEKALAIDPDCVDAHNNIGVALTNLGDYDGAFEAYDRAMSIDPEFPNQHLNRSLVLLLKGDYCEGWRQFEWRFKSKPWETNKRDFAQPQWEGEALAGKRILLHWEQGFGDTFQMVRYAPMVAARGGEVILECQPPTVRLLKGIDGVAEVVPAGSQLPRFDCYRPMMGLPRVFETTVETIPNDVPYIQPADSDVEAWRERLGPHEGLRVGLVWSGNPMGRMHLHTTVGVEGFSAVTAVDGVSFYSLQVGEPAAEISRFKDARVVDLCRQLSDFGETAAAISQLDLVISVDTAVAHLAGAMGKEVWVLLPYVPDWRWLLDRDDSPWYPTARLFRQEKAGDWASVVKRVCKALRVRKNV